MLITCDCVGGKHCGKLRVLDYDGAVDISVIPFEGETQGIYLEKEKIKKLIKFLEKISHQEIETS